MRLSREYKIDHIDMPATAETGLDRDSRGTETA